MSFEGHLRSFQGHLRSILAFFHPIITPRWVDIFLCLNSPKHSVNDLLPGYVYIFGNKFDIFVDILATVHNLQKDFKKMIFHIFTYR